MDQPEYVGTIPKDDHTMRRTAIHDLDAGGLVRQITDELQHRCRALEEVVGASRRLEHYSDTVIEFVKTINSAFFEFIDLLDQGMRAGGLGDAELRIDREQPELIRRLHSHEEWAIKHFSLVRASLRVRLRYLAYGEEMHVETLSAAVLFQPHGGVIEWTDGVRDLFRSHRENAAHDPRFGTADFLDLVAMIGLRTRGRQDVGAGRVRDEPEIIVLRRICQDERWPGWEER